MSKSFRITDVGNVFQTDGRITHIPWMNWDITKAFHGGLPVRGTYVFAVTAFSIWVLTKLPGLDLFLETIPWILRTVGIPFLFGWLSMKKTPDERTPWSYLFGHLRLRSQARDDHDDWCGTDEATAIHADLTSSTIRNGQIKGPARIIFNQPVKFARGGQLVAKADEEGQTGPVVLCPRTEMRIKR
jgi:hypothetical protein